MLMIDVELEFHPGLNVLMGESGAGKSFILRALDFILGERIAADLVLYKRSVALCNLNEINVCVHIVWNLGSCLIIDLRFWRHIIDIVATTLMQRFS